MEKLKMIASKPHSFGMRTVAAGEEFEVDNEQQARTLISLGRAVLKAAKSTKAEPTTTKREEPTKQEEPAKPDRKATYTTRRVKAGDE